MKKLLLLTLLLLAGICPAQFNYTISIDSSVTYQNLTEPTNLNSGDKWSRSYKIPVGFAFPFNGKTIDSVSFESNGYLIIDQKLNTALMAFNNFHCKLDSNQSYSALNYKLSGTEGSRVFKIECKNIGQGDEGKELLCYQVWLKESGNIEVFIGQNTYTPLQGAVDTMQVIHMGIINRNMDTAERGIFISGTPNNPTSVPLNDEHPELAFLRTVPKKGYRYIFTPIAD